MSRNWAAFDRASNPRGTNEMWVSLESKGTARFNAPVYDALNRPEYVELLWDAEGHAMGLRATDETLPWAFKVRKHAQSASYIVSVISFSRFNSIDISETRRYRATLEDNVVVVDLNQTPARAARAHAKNDEAEQPALLALTGMR